MTFGKRLRELREERGLTLEEIGEKFNRGRTAFSNYENGHRKPNMDLVEKMADFFDVSVDYLLGRTDNKHEMVLRIVDEDGKVVPKNILADNGKGEKIRILLHEARGLSESDLQKIIQVARAWNQGKI